MPTQQDQSNVAQTSSDGSQLPYTIEREGDDLIVKFTRGQMQGDEIRLNSQQLAATRDRAPLRTTDQSAAGLPATSYHDGQGRQISQQEYERLAALEIAEVARQRALNRGNDGDSESE